MDKLEFNCKTATEQMIQIKRLQSKLLANLGNPEKSWPLKQSLETLVTEAKEFFDLDQVELRDKIAQEKGYLFVGKFNRNGLAIAEAKNSPDFQGKWVNSTFYINRQGERVIPKDAEGPCWVEEFSEGFAVVRVVNDEDKRISYFVDEKGKRVDDRDYEDAYNYKFGRALVKEKETDYYSVIHRDGREIHKIPGKDSEGYPTDFRWYTEGFLGLHETGYGAWYITPAGKRIPSDPDKFFEDGMGNLNDGIAKVAERQPTQEERHKKDRYYFINQKGERLNKGILAEDLWKTSSNFIDGKALVVTFDDRKQYLIDTEGNVLKEFDGETYGVFRGFYGNRVVFEKDLLQTLYDLNGEQIGQSHQWIIDFSEGIGFAGDRIVTQFDNNGQSATRVEENYKLMTEDGEIIEPEGEIEIPYPFKDGVSRCGTRDFSPSGIEIPRYFYINKKGHQVFKGAE